MSAPPGAPEAPVLRVLLVDDDTIARKHLRTSLESARCAVVETPTAQQALALAGERTFDLVILSHPLGGRSGLERLPTLRSLQSRAEIVVSTAHGTVEMAVSAMRQGATDLLVRPPTALQLAHVIERARARACEEALDGATRAPSVLVDTAAPAMRKVFDAIDRVAGHDVPVLLRGEHGTGKSGLAHLLHRLSRRKDGPFAVAHCPTLATEVLAAEVFGQVHGLATEVPCALPGKLESAHGGTLFLDEIGDVSRDVQARLLRVLQERSFERVGESRTRRVDVRIIAGSRRDLEADVAQGRFREDLLYYLNTVEIAVPPLRERKEDVPALAGELLLQAAAAAGRVPPKLAPATLARLCGYEWPGNVRELKNALERALIFAPGDLIEPDALPERIAGACIGPWLGGDFTLAQIEEVHIARVAARLPTQEAAARVLGVDVSTLWRRRRRHA